MDKIEEKEWMLQHWLPNAAALEEKLKLAVASMPQHWVANAAALVPEAEKNKEFDFY